MNEYNDNYDTCESTYSTLRVYPNDIHPDEITKSICITPSSFQVKGEHNKFGKATKEIKIHGWFLTTKNEMTSKDTRRHIDWIINKIKKQKTVIHELQSKGVKFELSCYWESKYGQGGPMLSPPQMAELAKLNISVFWDIY